MVTRHMGEAELLRQLREVGYQVDSLAELRNSRVRYQKAVPILVAALTHVREKNLLEGVVRALSVPWARPLAVSPLIDLFRTVDDATGLGLRWTIGNALETVWSDDHFDELVSLAVDRDFGRAREMVVLGFARSKRAQAGSVLAGLLEDPDVNGHAADALRKVTDPAARPGLERLLSDKRAWVRKAAQRALKRMEESP